MFKIVDAVQIAANAGWPNAPNREGTGFANIGEEFTLRLKLISADSRAYESTKRMGTPSFDSRRLCIRIYGGVHLFPRR
jgi:hypothetical protein